MKKLITSVLLTFSLLGSIAGYSQKKPAAVPAPPTSSNPIYVDKAGVLRWTKDNREAAFFGVNYTVPFAYGYRSVKALGIDPEKAIDQDVYHLARLGFDAFR